MFFPLHSLSFHRGVNITSFPLTRSHKVCGRVSCWSFNTMDKERLRCEPRVRTSLYNNYISIAKELHNHIFSTPAVKKLNQPTFGWNIFGTFNHFREILLNLLLRWDGAWSQNPVTSSYFLLIKLVWILKTIGNKLIS